MFVSRGDRDLGVAFLMHPRSQDSSREEGKDSALLSSPHGYFLETTEWPKGPKLLDAFQARVFKLGVRVKGHRMCDQLLDFVLIGWW